MLGLNAAYPCAVEICLLRACTPPRVDWGTCFVGAILLMLILWDGRMSQAKKSSGKEREAGVTSSLKSLRESRIVETLGSAEFMELPAFSKYREEFLADDAFRVFQQELLNNPEAGDVIAGTGGLRKVRVGDEARGKGKRGGCRVIYFWARHRIQFWLFTIYGKDEQDDLTSDQKKALRNRVKMELAR